MTCPACNGSGNAILWVGHEGYETDKGEPCPECKGWGNISDGE